MVVGDEHARLQGDAHRSALRPRAISSRTRREARRSAELVRTHMCVTMAREVVRRQWSLGCIRRSCREVQAWPVRDPDSRTSIVARYREAIVIQADEASHDAGKEAEVLWRTMAAVRASP
jgi:predicted Fe-S protein YdhL (DUF1289 family)